MSLFDLVLLPGRKYADRFSKLGYVRQGQYVITGWPKFEAVRALAPVRRRLFDNDNPVVVYNPHFDQRIGSWARMGRSVLDYLRRQPAVQPGLRAASRALQAALAASRHVAGRCTAARRTS